MSVTQPYEEEAPAPYVYHGNNSTGGRLNLIPVGLSLPERAKLIFASDWELK